MVCAMTVTIYHNPACGTSRTTLALIRAAGIEPHVIDYLKTPPDRATLAGLLARMAIPARDLVRWKEPQADALAPDAPEDQLIDAMLAHPILMNRPIVTTPKGARLCRPADRVADLL